MIKKTVSIIIALCLALSAVASLCGCVAEAPGQSGTEQAVSNAIPEAGIWKATVKLSDLRDQIPFWARLLISIVAGNTAFEVELNISDDGTFSYLTNTETIEKTVTDSANTILGYFLKDLDLSYFIRNAVESILPESVFGADRDCFGDYERGEDGVITCTTTQDKTIKFKYFGKYLVQFDSDDEQIQLLKFTRE
jgi:hypothetical protein